MRDNDPPSPFRSAAWWTGTAILALAALLRLAWLDIKPAHFDEGVNGWLVDGMTHQGYYHYEPSNFHGPLHFYALFISQTLLGRNLWALRLPTALVSIGCVAMVLAFRSHFTRRACQIAALGMAVSPGMVFYGRDAIHETWLVFFLLLTTWGLAGLWRHGARHHLWAAALGCTGMVLTKETYVIHFAALVLAAAFLIFLRKLRPGAPLPIARQRWSTHDMLRAGSVSAALIVFFYSGGLLDWPDFRKPNDEPRGSLAGLFETFGFWISKGVTGEGHEKPWSYWLELITIYEWVALTGLVSVVFLLLPRRGALTRHCPGPRLPVFDRLKLQTARLFFVPRRKWFATYLAVYAVATLIAYSSIGYKTPWCLMAMIWPLHLLFGVAVDRAMARIDRWVIGSTAALIGAFSLAAACDLNFREFTNENEPYVYVQTLPDINKLLTPLRTLVRIDARNYHILGYVMTPDHHPLPWLLADFTRLQLFTPEDTPDPADAEFLLVDETRVEAIEETLTRSYFKEPLRMRGNAADSSVLYLDAETFQVCFPSREPEFAP